MRSITVYHKDHNKYFWAKYWIYSGTTLSEAAHALAIGQSIGNPNARSVWETDEMIENHCAKIHYDNGFNPEDKSGFVNIGFPYANIDWETDGVSQLLCMLMGGQLDIDVLRRCALMDLEIDISKTDFLGPKMGISKIRDYTNTYGKPLFGGIIKPKTGITPDQLLDMTKQLIDGGVNFIKEDEILGNPNICPFDERVELISNYMRKNKIPVVYTFCVNSDAHSVLSRVKQVAALGGNGVHLNFWSGLGTYKSIRKLDLPLFIHYQKSGDKILTNKYHDFHIDWSVLCKLAVWCGVDFIHAGMYGGYLSDDEKDLKKTFKILHEGRVLPALSCGMTAELIQPIVDKFGVDFMANVGGAIHSDPEGTIAGALKIRRAIDRIKI